MAETADDMVCVLCSLHNYVLSINLNLWNNRNSASSREIGKSTSVLSMTGVPTHVDLSGDWRACTCTPGNRIFVGKPRMTSEISGSRELHGVKQIVNLAQSCFDSKSSGFLSRWLCESSE